MPKPSKKVVESSSDSDDSSSEEKVVPQKRVRAASNASAKSDASSAKGKKAAPAKKAPAKKAASSSSSDSSSEDEKPVKKAAPAKKVAAKKDSSSEDSSSEDEKSVKKAPAKKAAKKDSSSSSSSEDEKPAKKGGKKAESSDSEESEQEAAPVKTSKPAAPANPEDADKLELFVKSLSFDVDENMLYEIFSKYGTLTKTKLIQKDGRSRGIAFVEYENHADAAKALAAENGNSHCGREIQVEFSGNKPAGDASVTGVAGESTCIFCGNIGFYTTEETIRGFFSQLGGNVVAVRIATDAETGRARGFCHVEMETPEQAQQCMTLNG